MNSITITGNLVADPELRFTPTGKPVTKFRIASTQGKDKEGIFIDVEAWNDIAENIAELSKGCRLVVTGEIKQEHWEDKNGNKQSRIKIIAHDVGVSTRWQKIKYKKIEKE